MIIEIDIRIEDSDGKVFHRFENKYDDKISASIQSQDYNDDAGLDFCDFLSEYLSFSGSLLREKLFQGNYIMKRDKYRRKGKKATTKHSNEINPRLEIPPFEDSELEYRIRIGDDKVLVGKVPLKLQPSTTSVTLQVKEEVITHQEISSTSNNETEVEENPVNGLKENNVYDIIKDNKFENKDHQADIEMVPETRNEINEVHNNHNGIDLIPDMQSKLAKLTASETDTEIDSILNYAMMKAIEKYELNLAPSCDA
ncbi:MAG: hypothetical protein QM644_05220 [Mobilitalea sp.]